MFSNDIPQGPRPVSLLHIPPEPVTRILQYFSAHNIISRVRTCRMFHDLCNYPHLRYLVQMERCAVSDEMSSGLGYADRLQILENRELAWAILDFAGPYRSLCHSMRPVITTSVVERSYSARDPSAGTTYP